MHNLIDSFHAYFDSSLEATLCHKISDYLKKQSEKIKDQCSRTLKRICEQQITQKIIPSIQRKLTEIFQAKLSEINQYIYSLSIENLLSLRDQFQKDKINETMLQNQLMKRQMMQIQQSKKVVRKMVEICKTRECQNNVFFHEVKKKFTQVQDRINSLHHKVSEFIAKQNDNQSKVMLQIESIKDLFALKHGKRDEYENSQQDSDEKDGLVDKDQSEQAERESDSDGSSHSENLVEQNQIVPISPYCRQTPHPPQHLPQQYYPHISTQRYPSPYHQYHGLQAYQPYQQPLPYSHGYPQVQSFIPFDPPMLTAQHHPYDAPTDLRNKKVLQNLQTRVPYIR